MFSRGVKMHKLSSEEGLRNPVTGQQILQVQHFSESNDKKSNTCNKLIIFSGAILSVVAVAPVPYLVLRSVYYLTSKEKKFTFNEIMHTSDAVFWAFGPLAAFLATLAIAPFNVYNTHKTIKQAFKKYGSYFTPVNLIKTAAGIVFLSSGSVNGYNTNAAIKDVITSSDSIPSQIFRDFNVFIATTLAGLADARVVMVYLTQDIPRDYRYLCRGLSYLLRKSSPRLIINNSYARIDRVVLLKKLRQKFDDFHNIALLGLTNAEIQANKRLIDSTEWIVQNVSEELTQYIDLMNRHRFPKKRFLISDGLGSIASAAMTYYGNLNVVNYAYLAITQFFDYCHLPKQRPESNAFANIFSYVGYIIGMLVGFFLIRDLFFRDVCKNIIKSDLTLRKAVIALLPLIPAFSYGLLNVILTISNDSLSSDETILISCAAILGATVVSRYGIEGGLEEFRGHRNLRRELAALPDKMMKHYETLEMEDLINITNVYSIT